MSRRSGTGAQGDDPGEPKDDGLSIFGPLELPRDETDFLPVYEDHHHDQYGEPPGGTRIATPSMIVPPNPGLPPAGPPAYPGAPPPGYPVGPMPGSVPPVPPGAPGAPAAAAFGAPPAAPPTAPPGMPSGAPPGASPAPSGPPTPAPGGFPDDLFRPGPSSGPAPTPHAYATPPPPASGTPQYAAPAMPARRDEYAGGGPGGYGGGGPGGPGGGYGGSGPGGGRRDIPRGAIVASAVGVVAVLLVVVLVVSGVFDSKDGKTDSTGGSATPTPASTGSPRTSASPPAPPKSQAQQMNELLDVSAGSRTKVQQAVNEIEKCGDIATAVQDLNNAAAQRDEQVATLGRLKTDEIARGGELTEWLRKAWEASARADRAFAAWGQENAADECAKGGKRAKSTDNKRDATRESGTATTAKNKAVVIWNDAAKQAGLKTRTAGEI